MVRIAAFLSLGIAAGFAFATFLGERPIDLSAAPERDAGPRLSGVDDRNASEVADRLRLLERALEEEIELRQTLEAQLAAIAEQLVELDALGAGRRRQPEASDAESESFDRAATRERMASRFGNRGGNDPDARMSQLVDAGFSPDQAQRIVERESELRLEALYAQYEAVREGEPIISPLTNRFDARDQLREELGDQSYERYLEATGQSTSVGIRQVMAGSAGQAAGMQAGDEVIFYAGRRVFDLADLNRLTLEGTPGETVVVDVLRDGQRIQVYVPRGPIGIAGGRARGGR